MKKYSEHKINGDTMDLAVAAEKFDSMKYFYLSAEESGNPLDYSRAVAEFKRLSASDPEFVEVFAEFMEYSGAEVLTDLEVAAYMQALSASVAVPAEVKQAAAVAVKLTCPVDYSDYEQAADQTVTGNGWTVDFNKSINKTIVTIINDPAGQIKHEVEAAGFWYSPTFGTWNKKFTRKAHRAALELIKKLEGVAA